MGPNHLVTFAFDEAERFIATVTAFIACQGVPESWSDSGTVVPAGSQALPAPASSKSLAWSLNSLTVQGVKVQDVVPFVVALHLRDHHGELLCSTENARADRWLLKQACLHETRFNADNPDR